jgi:hypothetical protein
MSKQSDPLKLTAQDLHRFWFCISTEQQWYAVMRECREWFGKNWRCMSKVRRKLDGRLRVLAPVAVWFEVPDPRFATWISVKYSLEVQSDAKQVTAK